MHNWAKCLAISKKNVVKYCRNAVILSLFVCKKHMVVWFAFMLLYCTTQSKILLILVLRKTTCSTNYWYLTSCCVLRATCLVVCAKR